MKSVVVIGLILGAGCIVNPDVLDTGTESKLILNDVTWISDGNTWHSALCWEMPIEARDPVSCNGDTSLRVKAGEDVTIQWYLTWGQATALPELNLHVQPDEVGFGAMRGTVQLSPGEYDFGSATNANFHARIIVPTDILLPNLVELVPDEIEFTSPLLAVPGTSCGVDEMVDDQAIRCLRLNNAIGNTGDGPFEVRMTGQEAAQGAVVATDIRQRVYSADGSYEDHSSGLGQFHPTHGHMHVKDLAAYNLYEWDEKTGLHGDPVAFGTKQGFCLMDWEPMANTTSDSVYNGQGCDLTMQDLHMGVSVGWADLYWNTLPGQYIDVTLLADGTYLLIGEVAPFFLETDPFDNRAAVVVEIAGDVVTTHDEFGFHWRG